MTAPGLFLARVRWFGRSLLSRFGAPALTAILLGGMVGAFHLVVLGPQQRKFAIAEHSGGSLRDAPARVVTQVARSEDGEALAMERFYAFFRSDERQADLIARLTVMAGQLGLTFRRIEYRPLPESSLKLQGFQIQMPLSGPYPEVRNFVSTVLTRVPTMTLDQIEITRRKDGAPGVDAQVSFSYHVAESR